MDASIERLIGDRVPPLGPGTPNEAARPDIAGLTGVGDLGRAALWLHHDFLDEAHAIVQDLPSAEASYWHAILHRREPDAGNAKYWFRRIGSHPVVAALAEKAAGLGHAYADPFAFVDFCERVRGTASADEETARRVQLLEWRLLFDHCLARS